MDAPRILGSAPARSFDSVKAGLMRLRHAYQLDDESANAASMQTKLIAYNRILLIDALLDWIEPAVRDEAAIWDRVDRDLQGAKDAGWD